VTVAAGRLIVFEGGEGVGKSTQLGRLLARLTAAGVRCASFREPGGTPLGDEIRRLLLDPEGHMSPRAEALLFMASRAELLRRHVRPALDAGDTVLLDRFFLSTYAYQIGGRQLHAEGVRSANALATDGLVPDLTVLLTLDAAEGLRRAGVRGATDRMERSGETFHARVEAAFHEFATAGWQQAHPECGVIVPVDAAGSEDEVAARVTGAVATHCAALAPALGVAA
jgi:dTMP kinase